MQAERAKMCIVVLKRASLACKEGKTILGSYFNLAYSCFDAILPDAFVMH